MNRFEAITAIFGIIAGACTVIGIVWGIAWAVVRSKRAQALPEGSLDRLESRLDRIEHALDAVAVEVERVSEGQRFTARVLSEKSAVSERR